MRILTPRREPVREGLTCNHKKRGFGEFRLLILKRMFIFEDPDPPEGAGHSQAYL